MFVTSCNFHETNEKFINRQKKISCHENASNCLINYLLDRHTAGYIVFTKPTPMEI